MSSPSTNPSAAKARIATSGLRVEFDGEVGPSRLVVPVVLQAGTHKDLCLRVRPRSDVSLHNEVDIGDALRTTFTRSNTTTAGGSFFATASHGRSYGSSEKPYDVVYLEDLRGVRFRLSRFDVHEEPIALQMAFPISACGNTATDDYFAEVTLELGGEVIQKERLPREVHPKAGRVLLVSGYSEEFELRVFGEHSRQSGPARVSTASPTPTISGLRRPFLTISELHRPVLTDLRPLATGYDGVHLYTNVAGGNLLVNDAEVNADAFFTQLDGLGLQFIFLATCNSVQVVRSFRATDMRALVAATENLYVNYAEEFESLLYNALGTGAFFSNAFRSAASSARGEGAWIATRSGQYDPMFLDLKADFCFGRNASAT